MIDEWFPARPASIGPPSDAPAYIRRGDTRGTENIERLTDDEVVRRIREKKRMMEIATAPDCPFGVVIMQAQDRFSRRDGAEAVTELKQLARHVDVWFYAERARFEAGTFASNTLGFLKAEFAAEFRRAIAEKTHEAMLRRAQLGHVTGGKVFDYDNVRRNDFVERAVNEPEANVVRDIYQRYADGEGFKAIAHALNAAALPSPRPQRGRPSGWDPGTVRAVLKRPLYRGVVVYNRTKKRDKDGSRYVGRQPKRPEAEWIRHDRPELRLIAPEIADAVDVRLALRRHTYLRDSKGRLLGRPRGLPDSRTRHLLAGFIACACGARFEAVRGYYVCAARRRKGPAVCAGAFIFAVESMENVFLDVIEETIVSEDFIQRVLDATFAETPEVRLDDLRAERRRIATEVTNLTTAIAAGGDIPALVEKLKERDQALKRLDARLACPIVMPDREQLRAGLDARCQEWRAILRNQHVGPARTVLQHLVALPIRVHNEPMPDYIKRKKKADPK
jgi:site-specific DNA recombinase